jgi:hypothetical protein
MIFAGNIAAFLCPMIVLTADVLQPNVFPASVL